MAREARVLATRIVEVKPTAIRRVYTDESPKHNTIGSTKVGRQGHANQGEVSRVNGSSLSTGIYCDFHQAQAAAAAASPFERKQVGLGAVTSNDSNSQSAAIHNLDRRTNRYVGKPKTGTWDGKRRGDSAQSRQRVSNQNHFREKWSGGSAERFKPSSQEVEDCELDLMLSPVLDMHVGFHHILSFSTLLRWTYLDLWSDIAPRMFLLLISIVSILHAVVMLLMLNAQLTAMLLQYYKVWVEIVTISVVAFGLCDMMNWDIRCVGVVHIWVSTMQLIFMDAYRPNRHPVSPLHLLYGVLQCLILAAATLSNTFLDVHPRQLLGVVSSSHMVAASSLLLLVLLILNIWHAQDHPNHFSVLSLKVTFTFASSQQATNGHGQ